MLQTRIYTSSTAPRWPSPQGCDRHNLQQKKQLKIRTHLGFSGNSSRLNGKLPVSNLDSSSVNMVPSEYEPNLALVYRRTRDGPQGPKLLHHKNEVNQKVIRACSICQYPEEHEQTILRSLF